MELGGFGSGSFMRLPSNCHSGWQSSDGLTGTGRFTSKVTHLAVGKRSVSCPAGLSIRLFTTWLSPEHVIRERERERERERKREREREKERESVRERNKNNSHSIFIT